MTDKPRICLLYTGGTIGMKKGADGRLRCPEDPSDFLQMAPELSGIVEFDFHVILNKDSTNMNPDDWSTIARAVHERRDDGYRGFVIAHGTDTMHFSASAVAFALGRNVGLPVVFTGAQTIPDVVHGDARINLLRACKVATEDLAEVVISFGDFVFRGCRAQKKDERRFDAFESPACHQLADITEEIIVHPHAVKRVDDLGSPSDMELNDEFAGGILQVSLIPGFKPELLRPVLENPDCRGLMLQSFGAGNVPNEDPYSFSRIIDRAIQLHKPVIITSQFPANATLHSAYEPGAAAIDAGAIPTGNMTSSCAAAKFRWVLAQVERRVNSGDVKSCDVVSEVRAMMNTEYIREMDVDRSRCTTALRTEQPSPEHETSNLHRGNGRVRDVLATR